MNSQNSGDSIFSRTPVQGLDDHLPETTTTPSPEEILQKRIEHLPKDVGVMLLTVGFAGFVLPGILGLPFLLAGGVIMMPNTTRTLTRKLGMDKPEQNEFAVKQITRFLDDLDRRYPGQP